MTILGILISLLLCWLAVSAQWSNPSSIQITYPAHIFKVAGILGQPIGVNLTWRYGSDLDVYVYIEGNNLFGVPPFKYQISNVVKQQFAFSPNDTTNYYFRIQQYLSGINYENIQDYTIKISYTGYNFQFNGLINKFYKYNNVYVPYIPESAQSCLVKISTNLVGFQQYAYMVSNVALKIFRTPDMQQICIPNTKYQNYALIFTKSNVSIPIYDISYGQVTYSYRPFLQNDCKDPIISATTNLALILGIVIPLVVVIIIVIVVLVLYKKSKGKQLKIKTQKKQGKTQQLKEHEDPDSINNLDFKLSCPICLGIQCNIILDCNHTFHEACVIKWQKRNDSCPLCGKQIDLVNVRKVLSFR